jgi:hypothetical protein
LFTYEEHKLWISILRNFLHPPIIFPLLVPNTPFITLLSDTVYVASLGIRDQVLHQYISTGKIITVYIFIQFRQKKVR